MKIKSKEKTVKAFSLKLTEAELRGLHSDVYDILESVAFRSDFPHVSKLLDTLRDTVQTL